MDVILPSGTKPPREATAVEEEASSRSAASLPGSGTRHSLSGRCCRAAVLRGDGRLRERAGAS